MGLKNVGFKNKIIGFANVLLGNFDHFTLLWSGLGSGTITFSMLQIVAAVSYSLNKELFIQVCLETH